MVGWDYVKKPTEMNKERYGAMVNLTIPFLAWTIGQRNYEVEEISPRFALPGEPRCDQEHDSERSGGIAGESPSRKAIDAALQ